MPNFLFNKSQIWLGIVHMRVSPRRFNSFNRRWLEQSASGLPADQWLFTVDRGKQPKGRPKKKPWRGEGSKARVINSSVRAVLEQCRRFHCRSIYCVCSWQSDRLPHLPEIILTVMWSPPTLAYHSKCYRLTQFIHPFKCCYREPAVWLGVMKEDMERNQNGCNDCAVTGFSRLWSFTYMKVVLSEICTVLELKISYWRSVLPFLNAIRCLSDVYNRWC